MGEPRYNLVHHASAWSPENFESASDHFGTLYINTKWSKADELFECV